MDFYPHLVCHCPDWWFTISESSMNVTSLQLRGAEARTGEESLKERICARYGPGSVSEPAVYVGLTLEKEPWLTSVSWGFCRVKPGPWGCFPRETKAGFGFNKPNNVRGSPCSLTPLWTHKHTQTAQIHSHTHTLQLILHTHAFIHTHTNTYITLTYVLGLSFTHTHTEITHTSHTHTT